MHPTVCPICHVREKEKIQGNFDYFECDICKGVYIDSRLVRAPTQRDDYVTLLGATREMQDKYGWQATIRFDGVVTCPDENSKIQSMTEFPKTISEKAAKLLAVVIRRTRYFGERVTLKNSDYGLAYAKSDKELRAFVDYLEQHGHFNTVDRTMHDVTVTVSADALNAGGEEKTAEGNASDGASVGLTPKGTVEVEKIITGGDGQSADTGVESSDNELLASGTSGHTGIIEVRLPGGTWEYDLNQQLGRAGGFGSVYAGRSSNHDSVAIKQITLGQADKGGREVQIADEVLIQDEFEHIVPVLDAGNDENSGLPCIVMARAEKTLQEEIEANGPLSEERAVPILISIAKGLAEVPKLVHRDLKPANVLFHDGNWKVADFGIARFIEATTSENTLAHLKTKHYAAPEQWRGERATKATDVYALGCIAYALLTGEPPFTGEDVREKHLSELPPALHVSGRLKSLISLMLNKNGETRPATERVLSVLASLGGSAKEQSPGFSSLAAAGANVLEELTKGAAQDSRDAESTQTRHAMATDAAKVLSELQERFFSQIQEAVDIARLHERHEGVINVGDGSLHLGPFGREYPVFDVKEFSQCNWDVITGAMVGVSQQTPEYERSASLWYARLPDSEEGYRWYEVSYFTNPIAGSRRRFEPFHLCNEVSQADEAHSPAMGTVQVANGPVAIDGEDADAFLDRWARLLGDATQGKLAPPRTMPF